MKHDNSIKVNRFAPHVRGTPHDAAALGGRDIELSSNPVYHRDHRGHREKPSSALTPCLPKTRFFSMHSVSSVVNDCFSEVRLEFPGSAP